MKRLIALLFLIPLVAFGASYTEFYCDPVNGDNLNSGSTTAASAAYTSASGNWDGTSIFTVQDGTNPSGSVNVGDFGSVYPNGSTVAVVSGRITAVQNAVNGTVTFSTTAKAGVYPTVGTATRTLKVGGAWKGPNAAVGWPLTAAGAGAAVNVAGDQVRFNFKNNGTYSINTVITPSNSNVLFQGYSSSVGDGGKATLDGGSNAIVLINSNAQGVWADWIFSNNGTTGTNPLFQSPVSAFIRCVWHDARGPCVATAGQSSFQECEFYNCNKAASANSAAVTMNGANVLMSYCYFHDSGGTTSGIRDTGTTITTLSAINSIFDSLGGNGIDINNSSTNTGVVVSNCDFYNNTGSGIKDVTGAAVQHWIVVQNSNFIKNGAYGIDLVQGTYSGFLYNNAFGAGTQANSSGNIHFAFGVQEIGSINYPSNVTPYSNPANGNFSLVNTSTTAGLSTGRGAFTETDGTNSGTVGFPDIGAAQHNDTCGGLGPCRSAYGFVQ